MRRAGTRPDLGHNWGQLLERKESIKSLFQYKYHLVECGGTLGSELFTRDETVLVVDK